MCRAVLQSLAFLQEHGPARRSFSQISRHTQFLFARPRGVAFCLHNKIPLTYNNLQPACFQVLCVCANNSFLSKSHANIIFEPDIVAMLRRQTHTFPFVILRFQPADHEIARWNTGFGSTARGFVMTASAHSVLWEQTRMNHHFYQIDVESSKWSYVAWDLMSWEGEDALLLDIDDLGANLKPQSWVAVKKKLTDFDIIIRMFW